MRGRHAQGDATTVWCAGMDGAVREGRNWWQDSRKKGYRGEASADMHALIAAAASGRRTGSEMRMRSGIVASMRCSLGVFVALAQSWRILTRLPSGWMHGDSF